MFDCRKVPNEIAEAIRKADDYTPESHRPMTIDDIGGRTMVDNTGRIIPSKYEALLRETYQVDDATIQRLLYFREPTTGTVYVPDFNEVATALSQMSKADAEAVLLEIFQNATELGRSFSFYDIDELHRVKVRALLTELLDQQNNALMRGINVADNIASWFYALTHPRQGREVPERFLAFVEDLKGYYNTDDLYRIEAEIWKNIGRAFPDLLSPDGSDIVSTQLRKIYYGRFKPHLERTQAEHKALAHMFADFVLGRRGLDELPEDLGRLIDDSDFRQFVDTDALYPRVGKAPEVLPKPDTPPEVQPATFKVKDPKSFRQHITRGKNPVFRKDVPLEKALDDVEEVFQVRMPQPPKRVKHYKQVGDEYVVNTPSCSYAKQLAKENNGRVHRFGSPDKGNPAYVMGDDFALGEAPMGSKAVGHFEVPDYLPYGATKPQSGGVGGGGFAVGNTPEVSKAFDEVGASPPQGEPPPMDGTGIFTPNEPSDVPSLEALGLPFAVADAMAEAKVFQQDFHHLTQEVLRTATAKDLNLRTVDEFLMTLGSGQHPEAFPQVSELANLIKGNSQLFKVHHSGNQITIRYRPDFADRLMELRAQIREQYPHLWLFKDEAVDGFIAFRDLLYAFNSHLDTEALSALDAFLLQRMMASPFEMAEPFAHLLASHYAGQPFDGFLRHFNPEYLTEWKTALNRMFGLKNLENLLLQTLQQSRAVWLKDGWLTYDDYDALTKEQRWALLEAILDDDEALKSFSANFALADPDEFVATIRVADNAPDEIKLWTQNPVVVAEMVKFLADHNINPYTLNTMAKIVADHITSVAQRFEDTPYYREVFPVLTPDDLGANGVKKMLKYLTELREQGVLTDEQVYDAVMKAYQNDNLVGYEIVKWLTGNPSDLPPHLNEWLGFVSNLFFIADRNLHKVSGRLFIEQLPVVLSAFPDLANHISLVQTPHHQYSLTQILKRRWGVDPEELMGKIEWFYAHTPDTPETRGFLQAGRDLLMRRKALKEQGMELDVYISPFIAKLIDKDPVVGERNVWEFINSLFKSALVVYNPVAQIRNLITNAILVRHISDMPATFAFGEILSAFRSASFKDRLYAVASRYDNSILRVASHEVPEGLEILRKYTTRSGAFFRRVSNLPLLKNLHQLSANADAVAKYVGLRAILRSKYGGDISKATPQDIINAMEVVNDWLVDYRIVPPEIDFLRRTLGLFPFITFQYTIMKAYLRNPANFLYDALQLSKRIDKLTGDYITDEDKQSDYRKILPEYMRKNPLVLTLPSEDGTLRVVDLTFWLPLGVFAGYGQFVQDPSIKHFIYGTGEALESQLGSVVRPLFEIMLNKSLLTGMPIVDETLPEMEKLKAKGAYLLKTVPLVRMTLKLSDEWFNTNFTNTALSERTSQHPLEAIAKLFGIRPFQTEMLKQQRQKEYQSQIRELKSAITRIMKDPRIPEEKKEELISAHYRQIDEILKQYWELPAVRVPYIVPDRALRAWENASERDAYYDDDYDADTFMQPTTQIDIPHRHIIDLFQPPAPEVPMDFEEEEF